MVKSANNIIRNLFKIFPEGKLKNKIRCFFYNNLESNDFNICYKKNYFEAKFRGEVSLKSYINPYNGLVTLIGFISKYKIKEDDIIIDGGPYIGIFGIYASKIVKNGKVIFFEPDSTNYKNLMKNIKLNSCKNVIALEKGLWSKNTILEFRSGLGGSSSIFSKKGKVVKVPVVRIEDEIKRLGLDRVNFVKMDVEGAEIEAVKGCGKFLKRQDINFAISSYHILDGQKTCFKLEKLFSEFGFKTETSYPQELTTYAWK